MVGRELADEPDVGDGVVLRDYDAARTQQRVGLGGHAESVEGGRDQHSPGHAPQRQPASSTCSNWVQPRFPTLT